MGAFRYVPPYDSIIGAASVGSVDADFTDDWLTDGRPGYPVMKTGGSLSFTITLLAALTLDVIAVCRHAIRAAATITLGGDLSSTIATATYPKDLIPYNWYRRLANPISVSSFTLAVTGNTDPVVIGELYAGRSHTFDVNNFRHGLMIDPGEPFAWEGDMAPYDDRLSKPRRLVGEFLLSASEYADLIAWDLSTRSGSIPSLIIPDDSVNDVWLVQFRYRVSGTDGGNFIVAFEMVEIQRTRW